MRTTVKEGRLRRMCGGNLTPGRLKSCGRIATDIRDRFLAVFREYRHLVGKAHTVWTTAG
jgi:hypothetical protein